MSSPRFGLHADRCFARRLAEAAGGAPLTVGFTVTGALGRV